MIKYLTVSISSLLILSIHAEPIQKHFWYELEALYWQPWEKSVIVTNEYAPVLTTDNFTENKVLHPHFNWDWGFRLGVGSFFSDPDWSTGLYWTNFSSSSSQKKSINTNDAANLDQEGSFPIWNLSKEILAGDYINKSNLHWNLSLNLLDLSINRTIQFNRLNLNPFISLRSGWIRQKFEIEYAGGIFTQTFISPGINRNGVNTIEMRNNYWGLGPRLGMAPNFLLGKGFSLYGEAAVSCLMGIFRLSQKGEYSGSTEFHKHSTPFGLRWILDSSAGVAYRLALFKDRYNLSLKLGYEFHEFYDQMRLQRDQFNLIPHDSNLSLQGVSAHAQMDF